MPVLDTTFLNLVTREKFIPVLKNNLYDEMVLFNRLMAKGRVKPMTGRSLLWDVVYAKHTSVGLYSGYDTLANQPNNPIAQASLNIANYYATLAISGEEERKNTGSVERLLDMLAVQMQNAKATLKDTIATSCYSDGSDIGGRTQIAGLQDIITDTTGTYANINRATTGNDYWHSNVDSTTHTLANVQDPTSTSYLPNIMRTQLMNATHDMSPDLIITTKTNYALYMNIAATQLLRIDDGVATFGFGGAQFGAGVTMAFDTYITAGLYTTSYDPMFFLTLGDFDVFAFDGANFDIEPEGWRKPTDQDAKVAHILWSGQLRCTAPREQAVIQNIATS